MITTVSERHGRFLPMIQETPVSAPATATIPWLSGRWLDELLAGRVIPSETQATCSTCAMVPKPNEAVDRRTFDPETKCCTFVPHLPNFTVGAILADDDPALDVGRSTVMQRLDAKVGVSPTGLEAPQLYRAIYALGKTGGAFGGSKRLLCPHHHEGRCAIWKYREATCSTWFCKHNRNAVGGAFWHITRQLLEVIEQRVAVWCVLQLKPSAGMLYALTRLQPQVPSGLNPLEIDVVADEGQYRAAWGSWFGDERTFYTECARLAATLDWPAVATIGGSALSCLASAFLDRYRELAEPRLPTHLRLAGYRVIALTDDICRIAGEGFSDLDVPAWLPPVWHCFDGRPVELVRNDIAARTGRVIDESLLMRLVDFKVLVPADRLTTQRVS